jgi:zinc protease
MKNVILAGLLLVATAASATEVKLPVPELETLPNGMQLVWFLNNSLPIVDMAVLVKSGYRDDAIGKTGTSELLTETIDRGVAGESAQDYARSVEVLGASRFATVDEDTLSVGIHGLSSDAPVLLDLMSKMVLHPDFPAAEVSREHARLVDRWGHLGDSSESLVGLTFRRLMTNGTTYGRGSFLSIKDFTPKNTVLMVVGRVDKVAFRQKIVDLFGSWQGEAPAHIYKPFTDKRLPSGKHQIILVGRAGLSQAQVRMGFPSPGIKAPEHYSLTVANALLGGYFNSRLNSLIRDKLGLTYGIGSSFSYSKDNANFGISSATRNETVGQLIKKTLEVLNDLKRGPIEKDEVSTAKEYLVGQFPLSTSTLGAVAARWLAGYIFDLGPEYLNEFVPKVEAVTNEDVLRAMAKDLDLKNINIVVSGDPEQIKKSLAQAGLGPVKTVSLKDLL